MESFDYIVVGAGSAGCVLASRLTESGRHRVLVLEAGGSDASFWVRMPIGYGKTYYDPRFNWRFMTEPVPGLAGPCQLEGLDHALMIAEELARACAAVGAGLIFKSSYDKANRT